MRRAAFFFRVVGSLIALALVFALVFASVAIGVGVLVLVSDVEL
jgi:hypothetical protein